MFEQLSIHSKIVVTGPQRSGTRIAAQMIAADTGHEYVDELEFLNTDYTKFRRLLRDRSNIVVQAPHMLKNLVDEPPEDIFLVLMRRPLEEIHASEDRIRWNEDFSGNATELAKFGLVEGDSAEVKYRYWDDHPKHIPFIEVSYDSLRSHPLYVDAAQRTHFRPLQTSVDSKSAWTDLWQMAGGASTNQSSMTSQFNAELWTHHVLTAEQLYRTNDSLGEAQQTIHDLKIKCDSLIKENNGLSDRCQELSRQHSQLTASLDSLRVLYDRSVLQLEKERELSAELYNELLRLRSSFPMRLWKHYGSLRDTVAPRGSWLRRAYDHVGRHVLKHI